MARTSPAPVLRLRGVRHNNLKNFDLDLPLGRLIVITGVSGSGKSSLAFDTLFAEGQRRYLETFSPYARQFFDRMDKPQVDRIEGIPPAIAIEQRNTVRTTRSTVGTMTELCDYLKVLWPHIARLHCRGCGRPVRKEPPQLIWDLITGEVGALRAKVPSPNSQVPSPNSELQSPMAAQQWDAGGASSAEADGREPAVLITFDLPLSAKLSLEESLGLIAKQGYQRLLLDGQVVCLAEAAERLRSRQERLRHLTVVQDRLRLAPENRARFVEACEQAYHFGRGRLAVQMVESLKGQSVKAEAGAPLQPLNASTIQRIPLPVRRFSAGLHCAACELDYREPQPALFSFNHPLGACPTCKGFGRVIRIDYNLALPDRSKTLAEGVVRPWQSGFSAECQQDLLKFCRARNVPVDVPFIELPPHLQRWVIEGDPDYGRDEAHEWPHAWYGVKGYFKWLESKAYKMHVRVLLSRYRAYSTCPDCQGQRFNPDALLYRLSMGDWRLRSGGSQAGAPRESYIATAQSGLTLADFYALPLDAALDLVEQLAARRPFKASDPLSVVLAEVRARLGYLVEVGLGYLTLDRPTRTLSGGETERVSLTTCLGTRLVNTLYVLDEPSVGLHARDTARLVRILQHLRDLGNTVVVVEHEPGVIRAADHLVDLGPGSGEAGGQVVFQGTLAGLLRSAASLTGAYLSGRKQMDAPPRRPVERPTADSRRPKQTPSPKSQTNRAALGPSDFALSSDFGFRTSDLNWLTLRHATRHNLKDLTVDIPLNRFVCLTGVSGSGKTTLVREVLLPALRARLGLEAELTKASDRLDRDDQANGDGLPTATPEAQPATLSGWQHLGHVVLVDQSPIGKTPRSNPVVYIGAFDALRELFAQTDLATQRGLSASAFSFNSGQGQCERCRGAGFEKVEMQFLSDVFIRCPECNGRRYRDHILEVKLPVACPERSGRRARSGNSASRQPAATLAEWSIADFLDATADEAVAALTPHAELPAGRRALQGLNLLREVGLGYLRLGQPINTLSGGECQRLKLVSHLAEFERAAPSPEQAPRSTLFLFDEPTTGLHFEDVRVLLRVLQRLVDAGHSVLVIEHNLDVIRSADWVIDLGPEAGDGGGELVVAGTPEQVAACAASHTGQALRSLMEGSRG